MCALGARNISGASLVAVTVHAAVVVETSRPPEYRTFDDPDAEAGEAIVRVTHAALSSLAKGRAAGAHYAAGPASMFVPGVDGVGTLPDGKRVYFAFPRAPFGSMAERAPVRLEYCVPLPERLDPAVAAAAANPGMSSVAALIERAHFVRGEAVLINGATSVSGRLAVQVAKYLGARHVVATGRSRPILDRLLKLGADTIVSLDAEPAEVVETFRHQIREQKIDVVLDYLWGTPAAALIEAISGKGAPEGEPRIRFVQIGSSAGPHLQLEAKVFRSSGLELLGSGLGSVSFARLVASTAMFFEAFVAGHFEFASETRPLADVERAWNDPSDRGRLVFAV